MRSFTLNELATLDPGATLLSHWLSDDWLDLERRPLLQAASLPREHVRQNRNRAVPRLTSSYWTVARRGSSS